MSLIYLQFLSNMYIFEEDYINAHCYFHKYLNILVNSYKKLINNISLQQIKRIM